MYNIVLCIHAGLESTLAEFSQSTLEDTQTMKLTALQPCSSDNEIDRQEYGLYPECGLATDGNNCLCHSYPCLQSEQTSREEIIFTPTSVEYLQCCHEKEDNMEATPLSTSCSQSEDDAQKRGKIKAANLVYTVPLCEQGNSQVMATARMQMVSEEKGNFIPEVEGD